jgi:hypothetical protein
MPEPVELSAVSRHRSKHFRIEAYAIISSDGMIADANGSFPAVLSFEADKKYYERELDRVGIRSALRLLMPAARWV